MMNFILWALFVSSSCLLITIFMSLLVVKHYKDKLVTEKRFREEQEERYIGMLKKQEVIIIEQSKLIDKFVNGIKSHV